MGTHWRKIVAIHLTFDEFSSHVQSASKLLLGEPSVRPDRDLRWRSQDAARLAKRPPSMRPLSASMVAILAGLTDCKL